MVPQSRIRATMKMVGVADNVIDLVSRSMKKSKTNLYSDAKFLETVDINRGTRSLTVGVRDGVDTTDICAT